MNYMYNNINNNKIIGFDESKYDFGTTSTICFTMDRYDEWMKINSKELTTFFITMTIKIIIKKKV